MWEAWKAAGHSALNFEQLVFLASLINLRPSNQHRTLARLGAMIGLTALPLGLLASFLSHSFEASAWGLIVVPIAGGYIIASIVRHEGADKSEMQAWKQQTLSNPSILLLRIIFILGILILTFIAITALVAPVRGTSEVIVPLVLLILIICGSLLYRIGRVQKSSNVR